MGSIFVPYSCSGSPDVEKLKSPILAVDNFVGMRLEAKKLRVKNSSSVVIVQNG